MSNAIAQTILEQLGGNTFKFMVKATDTNSTSNALHFKFGRGGSTSANHCSITLQTNDTYMMEFHTVRQFSSKQISIHRDIYASNLCTVFEKETGLYTSI